MSIRFGTDVVTFMGYAPTPDAAPDALGVIPKTETDTTVVGCRHRPVVPTDTSTRALQREFPEVGLSVATQWYQTTCPPAAPAVAAQPSDMITVAGVLYQIVGDAQLFNDAAGKPMKVTFLSERQEIAH